MFARVDDFEMAYTLRVWIILYIMDDRGITRKQLLQELGWGKSALAHLLNLTYDRPQETMLDQIEDVISRKFPLSETPSRHAT